MAYKYGQSAIRKNNYVMYMRRHKEIETIDKDNKLRALLYAFNSTISLDEAADYSDITASNTIYEIDMTGAIADTTIDMSNVAAISGSADNDCIIIKLKTKEAGFNLIVTEDNTTQYTLDTEGMWIILCDPDQAGFDFYAWGNSDGEQVTEFTKIGACEEKPTIKVSQGQTVNISTGDELTISENIESAFNDLQVTSDNYELLRTLDGGYGADIIFFDKLYLNGTIILTDILPKAFLEITGNDLNKTVITTKVESGNADNHLILYTEI